MIYAHALGDFLNFMFLLSAQLESKNGITLQFVAAQSVL